MATRYAVANGNWSELATWDGGASLPGAGDDVYADGKTVTIDQDITVDTLYTTQRSGGTAGGTFVVSGAYIVNAETQAGITNCLTVSTPNGITAIVIGNATGGSSSTSNGIFFSTSGNFLYTGNLNGGTYNGTGASGMQINGSGTMTMNGNCYGGSYPFAHGLYVNGGTTASITGNSQSSSGNGILLNNSACHVTLNGSVIVNGSGSPVVLNTGTMTVVGDQTNNGSAVNIFVYTGTLNVIGNIYGSTSSNPSVTPFIQYAPGTGIVNITGDTIVYDVPSVYSVYYGLIVINSNNAQLNIVGNVTAGSVANAIVVSNLYNGSVVVTGNVTGGSTSNNAIGIYHSSTGTVDVAGQTIAGASPAIYSLNIAAHNIFRGNIVNTDKVNAICAYKLEVDPNSGQIITLQGTNNVDRSFSTSNVASGQPAETDVRLGIVYGVTNEFTGSCAVPPKASVLNGVPCDDGVGTWTETAADIIAALKADDLGKRLANCSTVETTGDQIVALNS